MEPMGEAGHAKTSFEDFPLTRPEYISAMPSLMALAARRLTPPATGGAP